MSTDGVSLAKIGSAIMLMVEMFPSAYVLVLDETQARKLAASLVEMADRQTDTGGNALESLLAKAGGKKGQA